MRVLAIPDLHAWPTTYCRPGETSRREEWLHVTSYLVRLAVEKEVDLAVAPGDYFVNARPNAQAAIDINSLFRLLGDHDIPSVGCSGNHDYPGDGANAGPVDLLGALSRDKWGFTYPSSVTLETKSGTIGVAVLPWLRGASRDFLMSEAKRLLLDVEQTNHKILIGHWAIYGCLTSTGYSITEQETTLKPKELEGLGFDAVILGHIHKPQVFPASIPILHTGALLYNKFDEEPDERKAAIVDLSTGSIEWHNLPARKLYTWRLDEEELQADPKPPEEIKDAICRITYTASEDVHLSVDASELIQKVLSKGAFHCTGVFPNVVRKETVRIQGLTESTSLRTALSAWLDLNEDVSEEEKELVLEEAARFFEGL